MKYTAMTLVVGFLLVGCAAMEDAYYVDREFGMATTDAFDRQIIHKDYAHAGKSVEGLPALHAESIMQTYHNTFTEGFTKETFEIFDVGTED